MVVVESAEVRVAPSAYFGGEGGAGHDRELVIPEVEIREHLTAGSGGDLGESGAERRTSTNVPTFWPCRLVNPTIVCVAMSWPFREMEMVRGYVVPGPNRDAMHR